MDDECGILCKIDLMRDPKERYVYIIYDMQV